MFFFFFLQDSLHLKLQIIVKMVFLENIQQSVMSSVKVKGVNILDQCIWS